jgi:hypothetical protein
MTTARTRTTAPKANKRNGATVLPPRLTDFLNSDGLRVKLFEQHQQFGDDEEMAKNYDRPGKMQQPETPSHRSRHTDLLYARRICKLYVSICTYKRRRSGRRRVRTLRRTCMHATPLYL